MRGLLAFDHRGDRGPFLDEAAPVAAMIKGQKSARELLHRTYSTLQKKNDHMSYAVERMCRNLLGLGEAP